MTKLTGAALDRVVANAMGLKSVNNCEKWGENMKEHFCPAEKSMITYQGECSWCGESEGSMTQEALKLALEALEYWDVHGKLHQPTEEAITAIKEALAQTQEPPPWWTAVENILNEYGLQAIDFVADFKQALAQPQQELVCVCGAVWEGQELVETPPQRTWVGLTDEDKCKPDLGKWVELSDEWMDGYTAGLGYGEAKLKEKNT